MARAVLTLRTQNELSRETTLEHFGFDQAVEAMRREFEEDSGYDDLFKTQVPFSAPAQVSGASRRSAGRRRRIHQVRARPDQEAQRKGTAVDMSTRETSKLDLRDQLRLRYGANPLPLVRVDPPVELERAFVTHADSGRTVITAPIREVAHANVGFTYLRGRFVEADHANDNGAMWTTEDLQMGGPTVAGGPLNWLHDDRKIIGALLHGELVYGGTEEARKFNTDQRKKAAGQGQALPDGSFPIKNAEDLANAIKLAGKAKDPAKARAHIIKRAKALGLSDRIPDSWKSQKAGLDMTGSTSTRATPSLPRPARPASPGPSSSPRNLH